MNNAHYYWYKQKSEPHKHIFPYVTAISAKQLQTQTENIKHMRLYGNREYNGLSQFNYMQAENSYSVQNRVTLNVIQSMVDTAVSKITKNKPKPYFLTDDGDFTLKRKAEKLTKFAEGQFYSTKLYSIMPKIFTDACIFGTGALKIYRDGVKIKAERVFIDELTVDDNEAIYGQPRQLHQRKWINKDVLAAAYPKYKGAIEACVDMNNPNIDANSRSGDMLLVVESWHLRSSETSKDGKHVICINNETLCNEEYDKDYFPFVFSRWSERPLGFWGQGIAEQLTGIQLEMNKILRTIQVSMHLVSVPKMLVEASSKILSTHLNNKIGGIIKWTGSKPEFSTLGQVPSELFTQLDRLYTRSFEIIGLSQLSAQSQKPSGLNSGKAMRTYNEIETERFMACAKRYEQTFLDACEIMIDYAKDIAEETNNYEVKVPGSDFLKTIKWEDVSMENDQYMMQIFPTSALSSTPSARLAEVQELMQAGLVSKEDGMKLLDFPDLKSYYNMTNSGVEDIERQIELMVDKMEYQAPEPFQNLQYGLKKMQQAYLMYKSQNAPDELLELFRQWMSDANELLVMASQPPAPMPGEPVGTVDPTGQAGQMPISELMPQV